MRALSGLILKVFSCWGVDLMRVCMRFFDCHTLLSGTMKCTETFRHAMSQSQLIEEAHSIDLHTSRCCFELNYPEAGLCAPEQCVLRGVGLKFGSES